MNSRTGERFSKSAQESREHQRRREEAVSPAERAPREQLLQERIRAFEARLLRRPGT